MLKYFTFNEMIHSDTAIKYGIDNTPTDKEVIDNINNTLYRLDEIRERYGKPIIINSGYRCKELNKIVGGKSNSQHLKGEAADLKWNLELFNLIANHFHFDQLIMEGAKWIHVSFLKDKNKERNQILTLNV